MTVHQALEQLVPGFVDIYGDLVESIVLFGSTARGTNSAESDVDIAVIVRSPVPKEIEERILDLVVDLGLACNKVLSVVSIDLTRYAEWKDTLPFYRNIQKEGAVLWQAA